MVDSCFVSYSVGCVVHKAIKFHMATARDGLAFLNCKNSLEPKHIWYCYSKPIEFAILNIFKSGKTDFPLNQFYKAYLEVLSVKQHQ